MRTPKSEFILVTPAMAEDWLATAVYERQRKRSEWTVKRLLIEIEKGRFVVGSQIHFGLLDGKRKLVNGQHTLAAIAQSGAPMRLTVLTTPVDNEEELGQLYARHDRHRSRTPSDAFAGMNLSGRLDLSTAEVNAFGPALRMVLADFRNLHNNTNNVEVAYSLDYLADHMIEWSEIAGTYFEQVREAGTGLKGAFRRAAVVAVGLVTLKHQPDVAKEFWAGAAANDGLLKLDPRQALVTFLLREGSRTGSATHYARHVAATWNRWFEKGEMQVLRPSDTGRIGLTIRGTPHKAIKRPGSGNKVTEVEERPSGSYQGVPGAEMAR